MQTTTHKNPFTGIDVKNVTDWETVIGLEIHIQLATNTKIFSGASTTFGGAPNTQACAIDLGMPGVLPVLNHDAVKMAIQFGLSVGSTINLVSEFSRKNYFYPDLPKGYQISQYELPIVEGGSINIQFKEANGELIDKTINITRAHLEEDAGKSLHEDFDGQTGIDLNRAGTPLLEIVSEPEMRSPQEAVAYLKAIHSLVRYLEICDGNMSQGSMRCDANISVRPRGFDGFGTRAEIKNVNSFRFVEKAIEYERVRQIELIQSGGEVLQETRLFDATNNTTRSMRSKEEANDYRYFPDPDLLPLHVDEAWIGDIKAALPELPEAKKARFVENYGLSDYDSRLLTAQKEMADYFEKATKQASEKHAKLVANWVMGELSAYLNKSDIDISNSPITPEKLGDLVVRIADGILSSKTAKEAFAAMIESPDASIDAIIEAKGLAQMSDTGAIEAMVDDVVNNNPDQVAAYRGGKDRLFGFFVGQVMKASKGKANPEVINQLLRTRLDKSE